MRTKRSLFLTVLLASFLMGMTSGFADPAVPQGFGPWQKVSVGDFMTIRIPGKFKVMSLEMSAEVRKMIDSMETYTLDNADPDHYQCVVSYITYNKGIMADLDGAANGAVDNIKKDPSISDMKVNKKYVTRSKMKGIAMSGSFMVDHKPAQFRSMLFIKRNILWMLFIVDQTDKKLPTITKTIVDSMTINMK